MDIQGRGRDHVRRVRILLAQAPFRDTFGYSMPPPGLLRLGGELLRRGHAIELEDLAFALARGDLPMDDGLCDAAASRILERGPQDVVGFSVMGATLPAALEIARLLRKRSPRLRLLVGGPGVTGIDRELLERFDWLDVVVRGEGEVTLPAVLAAWSEGSTLADVDGTTWRDAHGEVQREAPRAVLSHLGELAPYAWELLPPLADYKAITGETEGLTPIDSGRGCIHDCSFCTIGRFWERRSRVLPADRLVQEVSALAHIDGARNAYLCHDIFGADREHALEFCRRMEAAGGAPWECRARVDHLDDELLAAMGRAGCYRVLLGVESGAPEVRRRANKRERSGYDVLGVVERCGAAGVQPILSLILGLPGEGPDELEASLDLLVQSALRTGTQVSLHLPNPQPGCGLAETHGEGARPVEGIAPDMAFGAGESAPERELISAHPDLFSSWALLPGDEEALRSLALLSQCLPEVTMHYPRTWELERRTRDLGHRALFEQWIASGLEFPVWIRNTGAALSRDALRWEEAIEFIGARRPAPAASPGGSRVVLRGVHLTLQHDLPVLIERLKQGDDWLDPVPVETHLAVTPIRGGARSVRIGQDVVRLIELVEAQSDLHRLEAEHPGIRPSLEHLVDEGLLCFADDERIEQRTAPPRSER